MIKANFKKGTTAIRIKGHVGVIADEAADIISEIYISFKKNNGKEKADKYFNAILDKAEENIKNAGD